MPVSLVMGSPTCSLSLRSPQVVPRASAWQGLGPAQVSAGAGFDAGCVPGKGPPYGVVCAPRWAAAGMEGQSSWAGGQPVLVPAVDGALAEGSESVLFLALILCTRWHQEERTPGCPHSSQGPLEASTWQRLLSSHGLWSPRVCSEPWALQCLSCLPEPAPHPPEEAQMSQHPCSEASLLPPRASALGTGYLTGSGVCVPGGHLPRSREPWRPLLGSRGQLLKVRRQQERLLRRVLGRACCRGPRQLARPSQPTGHPGRLRGGGPATGLGLAAAPSGRGRGGAAAEPEIVRAGVLRPGVGGQSCPLEPGPGPSSPSTQTDELQRSLVRRAGHTRLLQPGRGRGCWG